MAGKTLKEAADEKLHMLEVDGIKFSIDPDAIDDIDVLDMLDDLQKGNPLPLVKLMKRMFGDTWQAVHDGLADENGRVRATVASEFFGKAMEAAGAKN